MSTCFWISAIAIIVLFLYMVRRNKRSLQLATATYEASLAEHIRVKKSLETELEIKTQQLSDATELLRLDNVRRIKTQEQMADLQNQLDAAVVKVSDLEFDVIDLTARLQKKKRPTRDVVEADAQDDLLKK